MAATTLVISRNPISMGRPVLAFLGPLNTIREFEQPKVISCPHIVGFAVTLFSHVVIILGNFPEDLTGRQSFWALVCHCRC
jgi:hypothetical protein